MIRSIENSGTRSRSSTTYRTAAPAAPVLPILILTLGLAAGAGQAVMSLRAPASGCLEVTAESPVRTVTAQFAVTAGVDEQHTLDGVPLTTVRLSARLFANTTCQGTPLYTAAPVTVQLSPASPIASASLTFVGNGEIVIDATFEGIPAPALSWGGLYTLGDPGTPSHSFANPVTGAPSCPAGYNSARVARTLDPESGTGATLFACMGDFVAGTPSLDVRGIAGRIDTDSGAGLCGGLTATTVGRALHPEARVGENIYACGAGTPAVAPSHLMGLYTVDDCGTDSQPNPVTGALSCPPGSAASAIIRVRAPEGGCGSMLYACWWSGP
jgi:hypothetical protein